MPTDPHAVPQPPTRSRRAFLAALGGIGWGVTGCRLARESAPRRTFVLQIPGSGGAPGDGPEAGRGGGEGRAAAGVLLVRPFRVVATFDSRAMVIRRGETEYVADPYNGFLTSPSALLTEAVAGWVRGLGVFGVVTTGGSQLAPTHVLEGEVTELYGDYRDAGHPQALLALQFRLLHPPTGSATAVRWQREACRAVALDQVGADALVAGWNRALGEICATLDAALFRGAPLPPGSQASRRR